LKSHRQKSTKNYKATPLLASDLAAGNRESTRKIQYAMTKEECKTKLKHQLDICRRLKAVGMNTAATESRNKARILLHAYKRHLLEESVKQHWGNSDQFVDS
jgi:hypothetical protein